MKVLLKRGNLPPYLERAIKLFEAEYFSVESIEIKGVPHEKLRHPFDDATGFIGDSDPDQTGALG